MLVQCTHHGVRIDGTHEVAFKFHYICAHYIEYIDYNKQLHRLVKLNS